MITFMTPERPYIEAHIGVELAPIRLSVGMTILGAVKQRPARKGWQRLDLIAACAAEALCRLVVPLVSAR